MCAGRESNSGLVRGRDVYYHCTTGAGAVASRMASDSFTPQRITNRRSGRTGARSTGSYGAMAARWIPDPKVGGSNPSSFMP